MAAFIDGYKDNYLGTEEGHKYRGRREKGEIAVRMSHGFPKVPDSVCWVAVRTIHVYI